MIDRQLAHYKIVAKLGEGGMGVVYKALDTRLDRFVALKLLPEAMAADAERLERFTREAKLVGGLNHPNIVTLHSVEEADGEHFLTMELVEGKTLDKLVPKGGLRLERLFDLAIPIADAVATAHEAGITHRDLKPANVMVTGDGRVKVLDFGLARLDPKAAGAADEETRALTEAITQKGVVVGTVRYMSPEQARGEVVDSRSDIFSLGTMLYEMATGQRPFSGASSAELLSAILRDEPPPIYKVKGELPHHLGRIIQHCLEKDPRKRYQSALDVRNELEALRREIDSGESQVASDTQATRGGRWKLLVAGAVALVALASAWVWTRGPSEGSPSRDGRASTPNPARKTLAVLPFENLGAAEDAYFSAGMTDELTSRLARVSGLGVISRTSAERYAGTELSVQEVGGELGVEYIIEGTVRWAKGAEGGSRVRITPTLVQVSDSTQIWSASFDRELEDVFKIQGEIASQVIEELGVTLLAPERVAVENQPTDNQDAYQAYLKGQENWRIAGFDRQRFELAAELFERAAELDPHFLLPSAELVSVYGTLYLSAGQPELLEKMRRALERAEALAPEAPEVDIARGVWNYFAEQDYAAAYERFAAAARRLPNSIEAVQLMAFIRRRQGRLDEAVELFHRVLELSPRDDHTHYELARTLQAQRRFAEADGYMQRARALAPDNRRMFEAHSRLQIRWKGDIEAAIEIAAQAPLGEDRAGDSPLQDLDWLRRDWVSLRSRLEARRGLSGDPWRAAEDSLDLARVYEELGESSLAEGERKRALALSNKLVEKFEDSAFAFVELSFAEALNGNRERALAAAEKTREFLGPDRFTLPLADEGRAWILATLGDGDEAVELLESLLTRAYDDPITLPMLRLDPWWDALRDNPRFKRLIAED